MRVHNFDESLASSHAAEVLPFWEECYRSAFGKYFAAMVSHRDDGEHQRAGIDRSVVLTNSKQILIDEKVRFEPWKDIALEYVSNDRTNTPGWVCKPLRADYIAYAVAPLGICYLLPVIQLPSAWDIHGDDWKGKAATRQQGYKNVRAPNPSYFTLSVAVPVDVLFRAIGSGLRVRFTPFQT
ncbi:MAG: hypothetical protein ACREA9_23285 [Pyrinomonadaceae bacterium]